MFFGELRIMSDNDQTPEVQSPAQEIIGLASLACLAALIFFYWHAGPAVKVLDVWWAKLLVYALIPLLVTFIMLYCSGWHREMVGPRRTGRLLLLSCAILVGVIFVIGTMLVLAWFCSMAIQPHGLKR